MDAYVYRATLYCGDCAKEIKAELFENDLAFGEKAPNDPIGVDSDDFPKGPYPDGGGEADSPQYCDGCGEFLENDLTTDGREMVLDSVADWLAWGGNRDDPDIKSWIEFYDVELAELVHRADGHTKNPFSNAHLPTSCTCEDGWQQGPTARLMGWSAKQDPEPCVKCGGTGRID